VPALTCRPGREPDHRTAYKGVRPAGCCPVYWGKSPTHYRLGDRPRPIPQLCGLTAPDQFGPTSPQSIGATQRLRAAAARELWEHWPASTSPCVKPPCPRGRPKKWQPACPQSRAARTGVRPACSPMGPGPTKCNPLLTDYERFNRSNLTIHYWSRNYRGCWHRTCPPVASQWGV